MNIPFTLRQELNDLSLKAFGVSSKWRKLLEDGQKVPVVVEKEEIVPGIDGAEPTVQTVKAPSMMGNSKVMTTRRFTVDSLKAFMLDFIEQKEKFFAEYRKLQAEEAQKKADKEALDSSLKEISGSAV